MSHAIDVACRVAPGGFACDVVVGTDPAATKHSVMISQSDLERLAPGHFDPEKLVIASFGFLLAREPRESILRQFDVSVIERYFPGYEAEIRKEMAR